MMEERLRGKYRLKFFLEYGRAIWGCDKCEQQFSSYRDLRMHKKEIHAY
jgi:hypothetical protein